MAEKSLATAHPIWKEALACFESLRRLGFVSDDIFICRHVDGRMRLDVLSVDYGLVVNVREGDSFAFKDRLLPEVFAEWQEVAALWNASPYVAMDEIFAPSLIRTQATLLVADLMAKGIGIPASAEA